MKYLSITLLLTGVLLGMTSCNDFIDETPMAFMPVTMEPITKLTEMLQAVLMKGNGKSRLMMTIGGSRLSIE